MKMNLGAQIVPVELKPSIRKRRVVTGIYSTILVVTSLLVGWMTISCSENVNIRRSLSHHSKAEFKTLQRESTYIDEDGVCVNALPYANMHDLRPEEIAQYQKQFLHSGGGYEVKSKFSHRPPEYVTLPHGSSVAYWNCMQDPGKCANPQINALNFIVGSAWTSDGHDAFGQDFENFDYSNRRDMWAPHHQYEFLGRKRTVITGDAAAFFGFYPVNFGHCLHDNLPMVAWLRSIVPDHTTFILPNTPMYKKLIEFIDPTFMDRIYFFDPNEIVTVEEGTLTVARPNSPVLAEYGNTLFRPLRHWIFEQHPEYYSNEEDEYIIFHTRNGPHTEHGRAIEKHHEQDILAMIRFNMEKYNRKEKLVVFSGQDEIGNILPLDEQFDIFRRASTIIGPHGSGLANNIWTYPFPKDCNKRVKMLEFVPGSDSAHVQTLYNGYYWLMRGMPIDWNLIVYASNSTRFTTYIRLDVLQQTLDEMWGSPTSPQ